MPSSACSTQLLRELAYTTFALVKARETVSVSVWACLVALSCILTTATFLDAMLDSIWGFSANCCIWDQMNICSRPALYHGEHPDLDHKRGWHLAHNDITSVSAASAGSPCLIGANGPWTMPPRAMPIMPIGLYNMRPWTLTITMEETIKIKVKNNPLNHGSREFSTSMP